MRGPEQKKNMKKKNFVVTIRFMYMVYVQLTMEEGNIYILLFFFFHFLLLLLFSFISQSQSASFVILFTLFLNSFILYHLFLSHVSVCEYQIFFFIQYINNLNFVIHIHIIFHFLFHCHDWFSSLFGKSISHSLYRKRAPKMKWSGRYSRVPSTKAKR